MPELKRVLMLDLDGCMLGINNRDLQTFEVTSPLTSQRSLVKGHVIEVSIYAQVSLDNTRVIMESKAGAEVKRRGLLMAGESGIFTPEHVAFVQGTGCGAILVGESLVKQGDLAAAVRALLSLPLA